MIVRTCTYSAMTSSSFGVREGKRRKNNQYVRCYDLMINITNKYKRRKKNLDFLHTCLKIFSFQNKNNVCKCISFIFSKLYVLVALPLQEVFFRCLFFVLCIEVCDPLVWVVLEWSLMESDESEIKKGYFWPWEEDDSG